MIIKNRIIKQFEKHKLNFFLPPIIDILSIVLFAFLIYLLAPLYDQLILTSFIKLQTQLAGESLLKEAAMNQIYSSLVNIFLIAILIYFLIIVFISIFQSINWFIVNKIRYEVKFWRYFGKLLLVNLASSILFLLLGLGLLSILPKTKFWVVLVFFALLIFIMYFTLIFYVLFAKYSTLKKSIKKYGGFLKKKFNQSFLLYVICFIVIYLIFRIFKYFAVQTNNLPAIIFLILTIFFVQAFRIIWINKIE